MNKRRMILVLMVLGALTLVGTGLAQFGGQQLSAPGAGPESQNAMIVPSHLDQALTQPNVVVTRGYTEIGSFQGDDGTDVRVMAVEAAAGNSKSYGVAIRLTPRDRRDVPPAEALVDEDRLDALTAALDTLVKMERPSGKLANAEGRFRTTSGLELVNFDNLGSRTGSLRVTQVVWSTGQIIDSGTTFRPQRFDELKRMIASAKEKIQAAK